MSHGPSMHPIQAMQLLQAGNARFVSNQNRSNSSTTAARRAELTRGQSPFAAVLACADSRTPPEHIFDAGLGELFVCRNAGNLLTESTLGSIEYAAAHTGCPLLCVLGHDSCGAVGAAVASYKDPHHSETPNVDDIVRRLIPAVIATREQAKTDKEWADEAAKQNVVNVCRQVTQSSALLREKVAKGEFRVVGGWYDLESGRVSYLYE